MTSQTIYCTYVTFYSGNKLPPFYIGSSNTDKIAKGYHGSVTSEEFKKIFKTELNHNPHLFKTKIISLHSTRKEAYAKEKKLQKALDVIRSPLYINKSIASSNNFGGQYGPMANETKIKISNSTIGVPKSKQHAENISKGKTGIATRGSGFKDSPESNLKRSESMTGRSQPKHTCPHCLMTGGNAMTRWHFDNCKFKST